MHEEFDYSPVSALWENQSRILMRVEEGGRLEEVLDDIVKLVEEQSSGEVIASILLVSEDGKSLVMGGAPSLPDAYNAAIHGIAIRQGAGSCGTAAAIGEPVYVSDISSDPLWTDFRQLAEEHGLAACWSVPIRGTGGKVIGTFANYHRTPRAPSAGERARINMLGQTAAIAIERDRLRQIRARAQEDREMLTMELSHRVKNAFTLASALVTMSSVEASGKDDLVETITGRLLALSRAHDLAIEHRQSDSVRHDLRKLIEVVLKPYGPGDGRINFEIEGPDIAISGDAVRAFALSIHELATNSAKYGAFSSPQGHVSVRWRVDEEGLVLTWEEMANRDLDPPGEPGFGTVLMKDSIERQLAGTAHTEWSRQGMTTVFTVPLGKLSLDED